MNILVIGGSGFLSGTVARAALAAGHEVTVVTRGRRPVMDGVRALVADREDRGAFGNAVLRARRSWDLVIDCIAFEAADSQQDLELFRGRVGGLVLVSTDFVYDPDRRRFPQKETDADYLKTGYGGGKRAAEQVLEEAGAGGLPWTVFRPGHIYGPGSLLGCLPRHGRDADLVKRLRAGETLRLVGGGRFLQQPVFAPDLAATLLSAAGHPKAVGRIFNVAGPEVIESRTFYELIAEILEVPLRIEEEPVTTFLAEQPDKAPFCCHRFYDLSALRAAGLAVPATPLVDGIRAHVAAELARIA